MAVNLTPFGIAQTNNVNGGGNLRVLLEWLPSTPRPIPPGDYDAVSTSLARLYFVWSRNPLWRSLAEVIGQVYAANVAQQGQLEARRALEDVCGQALDDYGWQAGLPRQGLGCEAYRQAIRVRNASFTASGTIADLLAIVEGLFGAEAAQGAYSPLYPAAFALTVPALSADALALLASLLLDPATGAGPVPSGVGLFLVVTDATATGWWSAQPGADETWAGARWGSVTSTELDETPAWGSVQAVG